MAVLTDDMKRVVEEQQLGFVATVCPDGSPNLSPKGAFAVWDDDHLVFADIRSPQTIANLRANPAVEINVVDPLVRKGYRFRGVARLLSEGGDYEAALALFRGRGSTSAKRHIVLVKVGRAAALISPAYDSGQDETAVVARWRAYWEELWGPKT
ncbi:MAG TPA: pyridoxamine 5'-phosphate oxidase family protein [Caulobacteraceae bacterium]|jgi:predicted pyridoxine 5'-phosphate oxidase superfamily flavin-nucleotide-binding protein|nr:pyridoxamine 5'-phosphate oxidase family protein [Caulobacteraceae bacterium]